MKLIYCTACALVVGLFTASCSSSDDIASETPIDPDPNTIIAKVTFTSQQSKSSRVAISGNIEDTKLTNGNFYWSKDDKVRLCAPYAAVENVGKKINNMNINTLSDDRRSATFQSSEGGLNIALGKDTYLFVAQNYQSKTGPGVSVDISNHNLLRFECHEGTNAILGSDTEPIDFFNGSIFTEFVKIPGAKVQWDNTTNSVNLTGTFKVLTPVLCFQLPEGANATEFTYKNIEWTATYNMDSETWNNDGQKLDKTIKITTVDAGIKRNRIVYVPVLPGSINDEASISCDGYTCSLKGLKSQLSENNNIIFLGVLGQSSHWVKDITK